jgi:hypothetical protein
MLAPVLQGHTTDICNGACLYRLDEIAVNDVWVRGGWEFVE